MSDSKNILRKVLNLIICLLALLIIMDFIIPGKVFDEPIINTQAESEQYYNAAGNYHFSYKVVTSQHEFWVSEDIGELELQGEQIEYSVSLIFKEINWYRLININESSYHSLRIYSALVIPLLFLVSILISYVFKRNIEIIVFILQVLLIADLIFLVI